MKKSAITFIFAHGAGADMDSDFMLEMSTLIEAQGIHVRRFNFDYMEERRETGKKKPPDRQPKLLTRFAKVLTEVQQQSPRHKLFIGGKSMGGRMATLLLAQEQDQYQELGIDEKALAKIRGVICMGYPFHPPGKPEKLRTEHLADFSTPTLIIQGERDTFGTQEEVANYDLSQQIQFAWMPDGDHSLKPRKKSGYTQKENLAAAAETTAEFIRQNAS